MPNRDVSIAIGKPKVVQFFLFVCSEIIVEVFPGDIIISGRLHSIKARAKSCNLYVPEVDLRGRLFYHNKDFIIVLF